MQTQEEELDPQWTQLHDSTSVGLFQFSIPSKVLAEERIKLELYDRL